VQKHGLATWVPEGQKSGVKPGQLVQSFFRNYRVAKYLIFQSLNSKSSFRHLCKATKLSFLPSFPDKPGIS
jgi:hypothetical protein